MSSPTPLRRHSEPDPGACLRALRLLLQPTDKKAAVGKTAAAGKEDRDEKHDFRD